MSDIDQAIRDGRVPPGYSKEFLMESHDHGAIGGIVAVTVVAFIIFAGRAFSRLFIVRRFGYDDYLASISLLCLIAFSIVCVELIKFGSGRHFAYIQYVLSLETVEHTQILDFAAHIIYIIALLFCRLSGLAFYHRICGLHRRFAQAIWIVGGIIIAGFLPQLCLLIFHCKPVTGLWPYGFEPDADKYVCLQWGVVYSVISSVSLACDFLIFGIPVAMLRILEMPKKRKIQLACILLPGVLVIGISIARLVLVIQGQWNPDMSWAYCPMLAVEVSEISATLVALSIPGVKPIFDKYILRKKNHKTSHDSHYHSSGVLSQSKSKGTALSTLRFKNEHNVLGSQEHAPSYGNEVGIARAMTDDTHSHSSQDGIYVRVDFQVKAGKLEEAHGPEPVP